MSLMPIVYQSTDPGAPALSGQAGSLVALLDAILVDGYGTGVATKPGLGWTREFLSVNKRMYRNNPVSGTGYYLRVEDTNALYASVRGFENVTDIDNGTGAVPLASQFAPGCAWPKSETANAVERPWFAIGTERCFYLFIRHVSVADRFSPHFAGDIVSYVPGDQHCFAVSSTASSTYAGGFGINRNFISLGQDLGNMAPTLADAGLIIARNAIGDLGAVPLLSNGAVYLGLASYVFGSDQGSTRRWPVPANGGVMGLPGFLGEKPYFYRGEYPGLTHPFGSLAYGDLNLLEDQTLISKRFGAVTGASAIQIGEVIFDLGREWH